MSDSIAHVQNGSLNLLESLVGFGGDCQRATDESPFAMTMIEKI